MRGSIGKTITLIVTILCFNYAGTIDDNVVTRQVVGTNMVIGIDTTHVYLYNGDDRNVSMVSFRKSQKILPNKTIVYKESNGFNACLWFIFAIGVILLSIGTFSGEDDLNWEFGDCWHDTLLKEIRVIEESSKYHWVLNNRLLIVSDQPIDTWSLKDRVTDYIRNKNIFPEFTSKEDKREKKLKKIGI